VLTSAEHPQHLPGMLFAGGFAEYLPRAFHYRIASEDQAGGDSRHDVGCFLPGEACNEFFGCFAAANAAFGRFVWDDNREIVACFLHQFSAARGAAGENKSRSCPAVHRFEQFSTGVLQLTIGNRAFEEVYPLAATSNTQMPLPALDVLYEDNHLLLINKPAGLPTMGTPGPAPTLLTLAKEYIKQKHQKPGNVYLGVMSRLDAPVTGVVLLARTSKAAARMTEQFRSHAVQKTYWALVEGTLDSTIGNYTNWIIKDDRHRRMHVVDRTRPGAKEARLAYRLLSSDGRMSLLEVGLETGRKHQIRLQMAYHGHPVVGDRKYGSRMRFSSGIALHARRMVVAHPVRGEVMIFEAPLPKSWPPGWC